MLNKNINKMGIPALLLTMLLVFSIFSLVGCNNQKEPLPEEVKALTEDELNYFNGDSFFNGDDFNINNQFLSSLYAEPADINLFELFYIGNGLEETITDEELIKFMEKRQMTGSIDNLPTPCEKNSRKNMDEILTKSMGLTLADTNKVGLDQFAYLSDYEAYYHLHGDTNYRLEISFSGGERKGDIIQLFYDDRFFADGEKVLTLQEKDGKYLFVANQKME